VKKEYTRFDFFKDVYQGVLFVLLETLEQNLLAMELNMAKCFLLKTPIPT